MNNDENAAEDRALLQSLSWNQMYTILVELSEDAAISDRIFELAYEIIAHIDEDEMAKRLFNGLNSLDVVELWESSGEGYYGYNDPVDVAGEMLDSVVEGYRREMRKFR